MTQKNMRGKQEKQSGRENPESPAEAQVQIEIHEPSCRGCEMCVDICPTKVFVMDDKKKLCRVEQVEDCIACLSCAWICPSGALEHSGYHKVQNFYRDASFCSKVAKYL